MALDQSSLDSPRALLERLIGFPTVSRDSNLDLIAFVEDWLAERGIESHRVPSDCGTKASLYASVGPDAPGGVALSGHTDVVPVDGQDWTSDPFTLTERDGLLYGRGSCDMKGFDALAIWAMGEAAKGGLKRPLQLALSYDEEVGCAQAKPLAAAMLASGYPKADMVIVGEPSMMGVVTAHKGGIGYMVHAKGYEVHSSLMHEGVSAIMEAAKIIDWANQQNAANAAREPSEIAGMFTPPWTTLHCGKIQGGTAHNITAGDCHFGFDFRFVPDEDEADWVQRFKDHVYEVQADMRRRSADAGFTLMRGFSVPGLKPEPQGAAEELTRRITGDNETRVVSYGTEAGHFQNAGYSVVVCGPGDIAQAHQADEFISVAQMQAGEAFMRRLLDHLKKD